MIKKLMTALGAVVVSGAMLAGSATSASAASIDFLPGQPGKCTVTKFKAPGCKEWRTANGLQASIDSTNPQTRAAAVYAFWSQYEGYANYRISASAAANASYRNDGCGKEVWSTTRKAVAAQYNIGRDYYNNQLWAELAVSQASPVKTTGVSKAVGKIILSATKSKAKKFAAEQAVGSLSPNPYAQVLSSALKVGKYVRLGQEMNEVRYTNIRFACNI